MNDKVLIYDEKRTCQQFIELTPALKKFMGNFSKKFVRANVDGKKVSLDLSKEIDWQNW